MTQFVAKMGIIPVDIAHQFTGIGIDEQLMRVKAMPVFRVIRPVDAIAIQRAGLEVGHIAVPDLVGIFRQLQTGDFRFTGGVKQTELHPLGVSRKKREVNPFPVIICAQLLAMTGPYVKRIFLCHFRSPRLFAGKQN